MGLRDASASKKFAEPQFCSEKVRENVATNVRNSMKFMAIHRNILKQIKNV